MVHEHVFTEKFREYAYSLTTSVNNFSSINSLTFGIALHPTLFSTLNQLKFLLFTHSLPSEKHAQLILSKANNSCPSMDRLMAKQYLRILDSLIWHIYCNICTVKPG